MITRELEAFVITAQIGSFQKASEQLFISSTALIKQINALEEETGIKLFSRTNRGIKLTEAGKAFHAVAVDILHRYHEGVQAARNMNTKNATPLRVGISPVNPYHCVENHFFYKRELFDEFIKYVIPISGEYRAFYEEMQNLGSNVDLIPYFLGDESLDTMCNSFCMARLPLRIAVPLDHPLSGKPVLTYDDLNGQTLITINGEANRYYKQFNEEILAHAPGVLLKPVRHYDFMQFNYAANYQSLILAGDYLRESHPLLKLHPVAWDLVLPYGVYYAKNPSDIVCSCLQAFQKAGISGNLEDAQIIEL